MGYGDLDVHMGGGKYLKIESGKPVDIHILTTSENIKKRSVHYDGKAYVDCNGNACAACSDGLKKEQRWMVQAFDRKEQTVKQFEFGPNIAIGIREVAKVLEMDGQTIHEVDLRISRVSEKPVRYQVVQRKMAGPIPDEILEDTDVPF